MPSRIPNVKPQPSYRRRLPGLVVAGGLSVLLFSLITACVTNQSAIGRVVMAMNEDATPLPETTQKQLDRFASVYDTYVKDASDRERLDYFNFAYRRVRASYVYDVDDTKLINEAIHREIEEEEYLQMINELIDKKIQLINESDELKKRDKIYRYLISKGYESELVANELNSI